MHDASMLLTEHSGKRLLASVGIAVPKGVLVTGARDAARRIDAFPVAVKAQVAAGGRGKAGGIRRCASAGEAEAAISEILGMEFAGERPRAVLIEPWLDISRELYLAVTVDGRAGGYVVLYSPAGGVEIESGAPPLRYELGSARNFRGHVFRRLLEPVESDRKVRERVIGLARSLLSLAVARDCITAEINPLLVLKDGTVVAADAKIVRDEAAGFRQADIAAGLAEARVREAKDVRRCQDANLMLVWLDGEVGLISGGAGMTMAAMDAIDAAGGRAACFLDCSGNPTPDGYQLAFELLDRNPRVAVILVSMFGGGLHMDRVARTLIEILARRRSRKPVVLRLNGTRAEKAAEVLRLASYHNHDTLESAVAEAVAKVGSAA
jgi:succinyl-CoA synthetase beta subunit